QLSVRSVALCTRCEGVRRVPVYKDGLSTCHWPELCGLTVFPLRMPLLDIEIHKVIERLIHTIVPSCAISRAAHDMKHPHHHRTPRDIAERRGTGDSMEWVGVGDRASKGATTIAIVDIWRETSEAKDGCVSGQIGPLQRDVVFLLFIAVVRWTGLVVGHDDAQMMQRTAIR